LLRASGSTPDKLFPCMYKYVSVVSLPTSDGRELLKLFPDKSSMYDKDDRLKISPGNGPESALLENVATVSMVSFIDRNFLIFPIYHFYP